MHGHKFLVFADSLGRARFVPAWAPDRVIAAAVVRYGSAALLSNVDPILSGARAWSPASDDALL